MTDIQELPLHEDIPGTIENVDSSGRFWFRPSYLPTISQEELRCLELTQFTKKENGDLCLARNNNGDIYRARINGQVLDKVSIHCIDIGMHEIKNVEDIFDIPDHISEAPITTFQLWPVRHFERTDTEKKRINKKFHGNFSVKLEKINNTTMARFYNNGIEIDLGIDFRKETQQLIIGNRLTNVVFSSYETNDDKLWVLLSKNLGRLNTIMQKLVESKNSKRLRPAKNLRKGSFIVAKDSQSLIYARGQLLHIIDEEMVEVHFIDFGHEESVRMEDIFDLPEAISVTLHPALAYFLYLSSLKARREAMELIKTLKLGHRRLIENYFKPQTQIVLSTKDGRVDFRIENTHDNINCDDADPFSHNVSQYVECLREEEKTADVSLNFSFDGIQMKRNNVQLIEDPKTSQFEEEQLVASPRLNLHTEKSTDNENPLFDNWSVGDRVVAYWGSISSWKEGVVHEYDSSSALVVCEDQEVRATYIDKSLVKPASMPVEALNMFETDVGSMFGVCNKETVSDFDFKTSMTMTPSLLFSLNSEELCKFARSGDGSRFLQSLVSPSNTKLCHKMLELLLRSSSPLRMMTNARSCFLYQKLLTQMYIFPPHQQAELLCQIEQNFARISTDKFGYHIAQAAVTHLGKEEGRKFAVMLENKSLLLGMIKSPYGTFVSQACVPLFESTTISFVVNSLLGHIVCLSQNATASYFIQTFLKHWGNLELVNLFIDDILRHLREIAGHQTGIHTFETLVKVRNDYPTLSRIVDWIALNLEAVYKHKTEVKAAQLTISKLVELAKDACSSKWSELLDKIVFKFLVGVNSRGRSHIVAAACHEHGCGMLKCILVNCHWISDSVKASLLKGILSYRTVLSADSRGCDILRTINMPNS